MRSDGFCFVAQAGNSETDVDKVAALKAILESLDLEMPLLFGRRCTFKMF